jgi:hypothetical protein
VGGGVDENTLSGNAAAVLLAAAESRKQRQRRPWPPVQRRQTPNTKATKWTRPMSGVWRAPWRQLHSHELRIAGACPLLAACRPNRSPVGQQTQDTRRNHPKTKTSACDVGN